MSEKINILVQALRDELQQYGEMLALLERQQHQIVARSADEVYGSIMPIKLQGQAIQEARAKRTECANQLAHSLDQPKSATFAQLIPILPSQFQGLIRALVEENNELLGRVRHKVRQNHLRLSRSIELMQSLLNSLFPSRESNIYNGQGTMRSRRIVRRSLYEAVC